MNWRNITTVYLKELKDSLRDRRTLISVIVVPTIVMPLMFLIVVPPVALLPLVDHLCIFGKKRRCLHDRVAGTCVVRIGAR